MKYSTAILLSIALSAPAFAKTDVQAKVSQLKENSDNSRENLKQYEDGLKIVNANLGETEKALKQLAVQKQALTKQTTATQKGKVGVDGAKKQLETLLTAERQKLDIETK